MIFHPKFLQMNIQLLYILLLFCSPKNLASVPGKAQKEVKKNDREYESLLLSTFGSMNDGTTKIIFSQVDKEDNSQKKIAIVDTKFNGCGFFNSTGSLFVVCDTEKKLVALFRLNTGEVVGEPQIVGTLGREPLWAVFDLQDKLLLVSTEQGENLLFQLDDGCIINAPDPQIIKHTGDGLNSAIFDPKGTLLAMTDDEHETISLFKLSNKGFVIDDSCPQVIDFVGDGPSCGSFDSTGTLLAFCSVKFNVYGKIFLCLASLERGIGENVQQIEVDITFPTSISFDPKSSLLVVSGVASNLDIGEDYSKSLIFKIKDKRVVNPDNPQVIQGQLADFNKQGTLLAVIDVEGTRDTGCRSLLRFFSIMDKGRVKFLSQHELAELPLVSMVFKK